MRSRICRMILGGVVLSLIALWSLFALLPHDDSQKAYANDGWTQVGDFQIRGVNGALVEGVDYKLAQDDYGNRLNVHGNTLQQFLTTVSASGDDSRYVSALHILSDKTIEIKNADGVDVSKTGILVEKGIKAHVVFSGVNINNMVPVNAQNPTDDEINAGTYKQTELHIVLAKGSRNEIAARPRGYSPAIRVAKNCALYIDDDVANYDVSGNHIEHSKDDPDTWGRIKSGTTYVGNDGIEHTAGQSAGDQSLLMLDSDDPGSLTVTSGFAAAGIGGGPRETVGAITIDGGSIYSAAYNAGVTGNVTGSLSNQIEHVRSTGAGIGGSIGGIGTVITLNGGTVTAQGSAHAAGVGTGWCLVGAKKDGNVFGSNYDPTFRFEDAQGGITEPGPNLNDESKSVAGDININGGLNVSKSGDHGNGFGSGCNSWNKGHSIVVTGGTLLPMSTPAFKDIGGDQGSVFVLGGSVRLSGTGKFEALIDGSMSNDSAYGPVVDGQQTTVQMCVIDMSSLLGNDKGYVSVMDVKISGLPQSYGMPHSTDENGKLYLWLPKIEGMTKIEVATTVETEDGTNVVTTEVPFYVEGDAIVPGAYLKQYIAFNCDAESLSLKLGKRYDGLPVGTGNANPTLVSGYGDTPEQAASLNSALAKLIIGDGLRVSMPTDGVLTDANAFTFESLLVDDLTVRADSSSELNLFTYSPVGRSATGSLPTTAGNSLISAYSSQFANDESTRNMYWGHMTKFGAVEISPADSMTTVQGYYRANDSSDYQEISAADALEMSSAGGSSAKLKFEATVEPYHDGSDKDEAKTCAAPRGVVNFYAKWTDAWGEVQEAPIGMADLVVAAQGTGNNAVEATNGAGYHYSVATLELSPSDETLLAAFNGSVPETFSVVARYVGISKDEDTGNYVPDEGAPEGYRANYELNYRSSEGAAPGNGEFKVHGDEDLPSDVVFRVMKKAGGSTAGSTPVEVARDDDHDSKITSMGAFVTYAGRTDGVVGQLLSRVDTDGDGSADADGDVLTGARFTYSLCDEQGNDLESSDVISVDGTTGDVTGLKAGTAYVKVSKSGDAVYRCEAIVEVKVVDLAVIVRDRDDNEIMTYTKVGTNVSSGDVITSVVNDKAPDSSYSSGGQTYSEADLWAQGVAQAGGYSFVGWTTDPATNDLLTDETVSGTHVVYPVFDMNQKAAVLVRARTSDHSLVMAYSEHGDTVSVGETIPSLGRATGSPTSGVLGKAPDSMYTAYPDAYTWAEGAGLRSWAAERGYNPAGCVLLGFTDNISAGSPGYERLLGESDLVETATTKTVYPVYAYASNVSKPALVVVHKRNGDVVLKYSSVTNGSGLLSDLVGAADSLFSENGKAWRVAQSWAGDSAPSGFYLKGWTHDPAHDSLIDKGERVDGVEHVYPVYAPLSELDCGIRVRDRDDGHLVTTYMAANDNCAMFETVTSRLAKASDYQCEDGSWSADAWANAMAPDGYVLAGWTDNVDVRSTGYNRLLTRNDIVRGYHDVYPVYSKAPGTTNKDGHVVGKGVSYRIEGETLYLTYIVEAHNMNANDWENVMFIDMIPAGATVVDGSVKLVLRDSDGNAVDNVSWLPTSIGRGSAFSKDTYVMRDSPVGCELICYKVFNPGAITKGQYLDFEFTVAKTVGESVVYDMKESADKAQVLTVVPDDEDPNDDTEEMRVDEKLDTPETFLQTAPVATSKEAEITGSGTVHYKVSVANIGSSARLSDVSVSDTLPAGMSLVAGSVKVTKFYDPYLAAALNTATDDDINAVMGLLAQSGMGTQSADVQAAAAAADAAEPDSGDEAVSADAVDEPDSGDEDAPAGAVDNAAVGDRAAEEHQESPAVPEMPEANPDGEGAGESDEEGDSVALVAQDASGAMLANAEKGQQQTVWEKTPGLSESPGLDAYTYDAATGLLVYRGVGDALEPGQGYILEFDAAVTDESLLPSEGAVSNQASVQLTLESDDEEEEYSVLTPQADVDVDELKDDEEEEREPEPSSPSSPGSREDEDDYDGADRWNGVNWIPRDVSDEDIVEKTVVELGPRFSEDDVLEYSLTVHNPNVNKPAWRGVYLFDYLPADIYYMPGTLVQHNPDGTTKNLPDSYYDPELRTIAVPMPDIGNGETYVVTFKVGIDRWPNKPLTNEAEAVIPDAEPYDPDDTPHPGERARRSYGASVTIDLGQKGDAVFTGDKLAGFVGAFAMLAVLAAGVVITARRKAAVGVRIPYGPDRSAGNRAVAKHRHAGMTYSRKAVHKRRR